MIAAGKPILVTGAHRSGTTWVGRMIAEAPSVLYIHEPFSVSAAPGPGICNVRFEHWYTQITSANEARYLQALTNTVSLKYDLAAALESAERLPDLRRILGEHLLFLRHRIRRSRALLKDPIAFFSAEWLAGRLGMDVVVMIRHPAAFVGSIKKLSWSHPFEHFVAQPELLRTVLQPFESEIREYAETRHSPVEQATLLWRLVHHTILEYRRRHPEWLFVRHEDVSRNPVEQFRSIFARLDVPFTAHVEEAIDQYSNSANPNDVNAPVGSESSLKRNSRSNIWNWKHRLTPDEIEKIRDAVEDISRHFYSDADWC